MIKLLKSPGFLLFWIAQIATELGDGLIRTVVIYLVATLTDEPLMIGLVIFAQMLPVALFGVFIGALADRKSKRLLLIGSNILQLVVVILMLLGQNHAWILLLLMGLYGLGIAFYEPARSSSIPFIVNEKLIPQAVSLSQSSAQAMMIIGPAVAGLLFMIDQMTIIFYIIAATYVVAVLALLFNRPLSQLTEKPEQSDHQESYLSSIASGVKQVIGMPALRFLLILLIPVTLSAGVLNTNINALFLQTFQVPAEQYGYLLAVFGGGAVIGALTAPVFLKKLPPGTLMVGSVGMLGLMMTLVLTVNSMTEQIGLMVVYLWSVILGFINASLNVPISALFLKTTPQSFLGRGASLMQAQVNLMTMTGILLGGWLAGMLTSLYTTAAVGVFLILTVVILPLFKGFQHLNGKEEPEKPAGEVVAFDGLIGTGVFTRRMVSEPELLKTLLSDRLNQIVALLSASPKTIQQIAAHLDTSEHQVAKEINILEQNHLVTAFTKEDGNGSETYYSFNLKDHFSFNIDDKLLKEEGNLVHKGVRNIVDSGLAILEKELNRKDPDKKYHVMFSTVTERMSAQQWR